MRDLQQSTAIIEREGKRYVAPCPDLDIASQGDTVGRANNNLSEALKLFLRRLTKRKLRNVSYFCTQRMPVKINLIEE